MQDKNKEAETTIKTIVGVAIDTVSSTATNATQAIIDHNPSVTSAQKTILVGPLKAADYAAGGVQKYSDDKEKYGEENAAKVAAAQTITSAVTGHALGEIGAVACAPLGPVAQAVCAISGEVLGNYLHDNVEVYGKTIDDHVGDFVAANKPNASSGEDTATCVPTSKTPSPKNNADKPNCKPGSSNCSTSDPCKVDKSFLESRGGNNKGKGGSGGGGKVVDSGGKPVRSSSGGHVNSGG